MAMSFRDDRAVCLYRGEPLWVEVRYFDQGGAPADPLTPYGFTVADLVSVKVTVGPWEQVLVVADGSPDMVWDAATFSLRFRVSAGGWEVLGVGTHRLLVEFTVSSGGAIVMRHRVNEVLVEPDPRVGG